jgi:hypothetical protein
MTEQSERREQIKLLLEYVKVAVSLIGVAGLFFVAMQWRTSNRVADETARVNDLGAYRAMTVEWSQHLRSFVDRPELRPYFHDGKPLEPSDPNRNLVLALADMRLDVMDAVLTYASGTRFGHNVEPWRNTFADAFRNSPVLCARQAETKSFYGLVNTVAAAACPQPR